MAHPRVRYDEAGAPKVCVVKVPQHLAKILYAAALRARQGKGGVHVEESDIVVSLIERWAEGQEAVGDWAAVLAELKAEAEGQEAGAKTAGKVKGKAGGAKKK